MYHLLCKLKYNTNAKEKEIGLQIIIKNFVKIIICIIRIILLLFVLIISLNFFDKFVFNKLF